MALTNKLKAIADAIRAKTGSTEKLSLDGMASAISNISTGGGDLPSFEFTGDQMWHLFKRNRLAQLHEIGYTTSNITNLAYAYDNVEQSTVNTPMINLKANYGTYIDCGSAFSGATLNSVNINGDGIMIDANGMFANSNIKNINFNGTPKIVCSRWSPYPASMFSSCYNITDIPTLEFVRKPDDSVALLNLTQIFQYCYKLKHRPDEIIIDHASFYNNGVNEIDLNNMYRSNYSMLEFPQWLYGFTNSPSLFTYSNLGFMDCYSLQNVVLPMSNNVNYNNMSFFNGNLALKSVKFKTQEGGTPYTANWSNSSTCDLSLSVGYYPNSNHTYTSYLIMDNSGNLQTFTNANDFLTFAETLNSKTDIGYKYIENGTPKVAYSSSSTYYGNFWNYKLVYCWSLEDAQAIRDKGYIPYGMSPNYSLYNHDSAVETINSLPDCSGCAAQTIKFRGSAGSAYNKAINTLTDEEIAVATAKNWTVALV